MVFTPTILKKHLILQVVLIFTMYGECGGAGFHAKTMCRYWAATYPSGDDFNLVKQGASGNGVKGGYFLVE